jgi:NDP-sugar pyrophosphorylase family protein
MRCFSKGYSILTYSEGEFDGVMVLNTDIFNYQPRKQFKDMFYRFTKNHIVHEIKSVDFIGDINTPEDLERARDLWQKSR